MTASDNPNLVPIVVGATGHRDLREEEIPPLEKAVREVLSDLRARYPHSPLTILSSLAEGADRLIARVALGMGSGVRLIVPLPLPVNEYLADFPDDASKAELLKLLERASRSFVIPASEQASAGVQPETRDLRYRKVGAYIARHSLTLLALWDGKEAGGEGGTGDIVDIKLHGMPESLAGDRGPFDAIESGPVIHVQASRKNSPPSVEPARKVSYLYPRYWRDPADAERVYTRILELVDAYNHDVLTTASRRQEVLKRIGTEPAVPASGSAGQAPESIGADRFAVADFLADTYKMKKVRVLRNILISVVIGFFAFQVYLEIHHHPVVLLLYPLIIGLGGVLYGYAKRKRLESKHEDYRALAEALRVERYWRKADIGQPVSDFYLHKHKGELEWIRYALRAWDAEEPVLSRPSADPGVPDLMRRSRVIVDEWIAQQRGWYRMRALEDHRQHRRFESYANRLYFLGIGAAVALVLGDMIPSVYSLPAWSGPIHNGLIVVVAMSLVLSAVLHGFAERMVFSEQSKQYARMAELYGIAEDKARVMLDENNVRGLVALFRDLGKESLLENGDWLMLHRARPIEIPRAA